MDEVPHISLDLNSETLHALLPDGPGVYLFKDGSGEIIYVGKAKNLKKRVLSYFKPPGELPHKTALMMRKAKGLDTLLTTTDKEAFILESNLIKKHLPRYNIVLRDDKQYPWLRLDTKETLSKSEHCPALQKGRGPVLRPLFIRPLREKYSETHRPHFSTQEMQGAHPSTERPSLLEFSAQPMPRPLRQSSAGGGLQGIH